MTLNQTKTIKLEIRSTTLALQDLRDFIQATSDMAGDAKVSVEGYRYSSYNDSSWGYISVTGPLNG